MERELLEQGVQGEAMTRVPVRAPWLSALGWLVISVAAVAGAVLPAISRVREPRCHGATRSVHLERQKRQEAAREAAAREAKRPEEAADGCNTDD